MAKIKFNLNFGGEQIRTLDDLRENFSIEDILDVFNNGMLVKWLDARNHKDELAKVKAIQATDAHGVLSELIHIFGVTSDESEIQESLSVLDYLDGRKRFWADIKAGKFDETARQQGKERVLQKYHEGYNALVQDIVDHPDDLHYIYDRLDEIAGEHQELLRLNSSNLFYYFVDKAPLAAFALFGDSATRPYYVLSENELQEAKSCRHRCWSTFIYDMEVNNYNIFNWGCWDNVSAHVRSKLEMIYALYFGYTGYTVWKSRIIGNSDVIKGMKVTTMPALNKGWNVLEPAGKKYMTIVWVTERDETVPSHRLASVNDYENSVDVGDALGLFPITDGVAIQRRDKYRGDGYTYILYMEAR